MTQKTILLIGNIPPPFGGVPSHIQALAPFLVKKGWRVIVLSAGTPKGTYTIDGVKVYKPRTLDNIINLFNILNLTFIVKAIFGYMYILKSSIRLYLKSILFSSRIYTVVRKEKVDIISAYHMYASLVSELPSDMCKVPFITTLFGEIYSENKLYRDLVKKVETVVNKSSVVLSCSDHCAKSLSTLGVNAKVLTHYYGIDTEYFKPLEEKINCFQDLGWFHNAKTMIFVGRMTHSMGLHIILEALPSLLLAHSDLKIIICGASGPLSDNANACMRKYPDKVKVFENVSQQELRTLYDIADFAVAPSINERACLGLAIIEAMSMCLPVVACRVGGTIEVVLDGITGVLIEPNSSDALKEGVDRLLEKFDLSKMGVSARDRVLDNFQIGETNIAAHKIFSKHCKTAT